MTVITYAVHRDGFIVSRRDSELAWPVLQYQDFGLDGDFTGEIPVKLERVSVFDVVREWGDLRWTRKIDRAIKNQHRAFWGQPALREI